MGILSDFAKSVLGLGGNKPAQFGVEPIPPASIHNQYSTTGKPNVQWNTNGLKGMKPQPSKLDNLGSKYKPGKGSYLNNLPSSK